MTESLCTPSSVTVTIRAVVSVSGTSWMRAMERICGAIITEV